MYAAQLLATAAVLYYRSVAPSKVVDKAAAAAVRFPVSFVAFQRTFLAVFILAQGQSDPLIPRKQSIDQSNL